LEIHQKNVEETEEEIGSHEKRQKSRGVPRETWSGLDWDLCSCRGLESVFLLGKGGEGGWGRYAKTGREGGEGAEMTRKTACRKIREKGFIKK